MNLLKEIPVSKIKKMYVEKACIFFIPFYGIKWYNHIYNKVKNVKRK